MDIGVLKLCFIGVPNNLVRNIVNNYADSKFADDHMPILGVDLPTKTMEIKGYQVKLVMLIISSDPHFSSLRRSYYSGGLGVIFMYDKGNSDSFELMEQHINEAKQTIGNDGIYVLVRVETGENLIFNTTCAKCGYEGIPYEKGTVKCPRCQSLDRGEVLTKTTDEGQQLAKEMGVKFNEMKEKDQTAFAEIVENIVREFLAKLVA